MKKYLILILQIGAFLLLMGLFMMIGTSLLLLAGVSPTSIGSARSGLFTLVLQEAVMLISILLAAYIIVHFWEKKPFNDLGFSFIGRGKDICWGH